MHKLILLFGLSCAGFAVCTVMARALASPLPWGMAPYDAGVTLSPELLRKMEPGQPLTPEAAAAAAVSLQGLTHQLSTAAALAAAEMIEQARLHDPNRFTAERGDRPGRRAPHDSVGTTFVYDRPGQHHPRYSAALPVNCTVPLSAT